MSAGPPPQAAVPMMAGPVGKAPAVPVWHPPRPLPEEGWEDPPRPSPVPAPPAGDGQGLPAAADGGLHPAWWDPAAAELAASREDPAAAEARALQRRALGRSRRCCGCLVVTRDGHHSLLLALFTALPVAVFCSSVVPFGELWSLAVALALLAASFAALLCAVGCDPGIVPPASAVGHCEPVDREVPHPTPSGETTQLTVCRTCRVVRPFRSAHCPFCDYCVAEYDHHCGVLGSCVAQRTFRFFTLYFYAVSALGAFLVVRAALVLLAMNLAETAATAWGTWRIVASIGTCIFNGCAVFSLCGQTGVYTYLACTGATQKDLYGSKARLMAPPPPSSPSCCGGDSRWCARGNPVRLFLSRLCGPMPPSRVADCV